MPSNLVYWLSYNISREYVFNLVYWLSYNIRGEYAI